MKRLLVRLLFATLVSIVFVGVVAWLVLEKSLPRLDGEVLAAGVSADVTIERDARAIPTITAGDRIDLAYATGYVHAQDRFFAMDLTRRKAAGELAELVGPAALSLDRQNRLHRFRSRAEAALARMDPYANRILQAYAEGVNDGLGSLGAKPFEYFLLGASPQEWTSADSILVVYAMYLELNDEMADRDVRRGMAAGAMPAAAFDWLFPQGGEWDAPLQGAPRETAKIPGPEVYSLRGAPVLAYTGQSDWQEQELPGSNNWAVAGQLTDSGAAIVANDMHLGLTTPNIFYRARLRVSGEPMIDLNGVTLPGAPILVAGSNGHVAWGNTNSYGDWTDAVIIKPGDAPDTYITPGGTESIETFRETIQVKDAEAEILEVRETIWGPIRPTSPDPGRPIAISWIAHHAEAVTLGHLQLETARNVSTALEIANTIGMPPQNFVAGDADGNIGWTIAGRIPLRGIGNAELPMDWSETGGWQGWVEAKDYPRIVNPQSGRIWTANARAAEGEALKIIGDGGYDLGARSKQIRDDLFAIDRFSPQDMLPVHLDDRALFLNRWRDIVLETLDSESVANDEDRKEFRRLVVEWAPRAAAQSVGYRLVREFHREVERRVAVMMMQPVLRKYGPEVRLRISNQFEGPLWSLLSERPMHLLTEDYASWDDLLLQSIDVNIERYRAEHDDRLASRTWGERNTAAVRHPLSRAVPFLSRWLDMPPDQLDGDSNMPRVQSPGFGASERFAVSPGDEANGYLHMPAGQSGHPLSDYYRSGHDDWVQGRPSSFLPGETVHRLLLKAASNP